MRIATLVACSGSAVLAIRATTVRGAVSLPTAADPPERRRRQPQHAVGRERREVARVQPRADREAELQLAHALVRLLQLRGLLPRRGHQRLLMFLHDARAERGERTRARIEVELVQPRGAARRHDRARRIPAAIQRRREDRIGLRGDDRALSRRVDDRRERALEGRLRAARPRRRHVSSRSIGSSAPSRPSVVPGAAASGQREPRRADVKRPLAQPGGHRLRLQLARERFEIAADAGAEFPVMQQRQQHLRGGAGPATMPARAHSRQ